MTAANDPSSSGPPPTNPTTSPSAAKTADGQTAPPAVDERRVPLPPLMQPSQRRTTPEQLASELTRLDRGIVGLVLVLAFLLASFAVRNSDFWMHLATGRLIAQGQFEFGKDPYSYMTPNYYWPNHAWLFDLGLYALTTALGGPEIPAAGALVVVKALLVAALAWVMIQTRRRDQSLWAPAACTGVALLVMSPRLSLHPMLVSLFFLALTLYLLQLPRPSPATGRRQKEGGRSPLPAYWLLPPLFVLWVNLDAWFVLGPFTVALYLIGQSLQQWFAPIRTGEEAPLPGHPLRLFVVLLVALAACLINPHHYHAFRLPTAFYSAGLMPVLEKDPYLRQFFLSPWFKPPDSLAELAYLLFFALGVVSFILSMFGGWRWWRLVIWLAFAMLSVPQVRNVPFFAVVAGPITALNLQDFAAARSGKTRRSERLWLAGSLGGRIVTILIGAGLLLASWPGWLHGIPTRLRQLHRVAWTIELDPSLRQVAEQLRAWRNEGLLQPEENGFNYNPDLPYYCAWFCPEEKGFFDTRLEVFPKEVAKTYVHLRETFRRYPATAGSSGAERESWQKVFQRNHISHVVLNGLDPESGLLNTAVVAPALLRDWYEWSLLYMDGRTAVFRWNHAPAGSDRIKRFDPNPLAFGPHAEVAPFIGPGRAPQLPDLWDRFLHGAPAPSPEADKADRYLAYFEYLRLHWVSAILTAEFAAWSGTIGNAAASPATGTVAAPATLIQTSAPTQAALRGALGAQEYFLRDKDIGPPAAPLLAVRAARRAIAANPDDAAPYLSLAEAYTLLLRMQEQHWTIGSQIVTQGLLPRQTIRQMQITAALEHLLKMRPDDFFSHRRLYETFREMNNFDKAMEHLETAIRCVESSALRRRDEKEFKRTMESLQKELEGLRSQVTQRENEFALRVGDRPADLPLLKRAQLAISLGLGKRALSLLLEADSAQMDREEANLQLELLLEAGQPELVQERLPDVKGVLIGLNYEFLKLLTSAVMGDYHQADEYLDEVISRQEKDKTKAILLGLAHGQAFLGNLNQGTLPSLLFTSRQIAEFQVLRGLLALEAGRTAAAARYFQQALDSGGGDAFDFASRGVAARYLQLIKQAGGDKEVRVPPSGGKAG